MLNSADNIKTSDHKIHHLTFKTSTWVALGHCWQQGLRFASNLILTRLLMPADFGLMQLTFIFIQAIAMFSDLGISYNIIQHPKGDQPSFLRTAWTVQILRGLLIALILCLIAYPLSIIYQAPMLAYLIPVAALSSIIDGLNSTTIIMLNRKMNIGKLTLLDMLSQLIGICAMICCAWYFRSVWCLLVFTFVSGSLKNIFSHVAFAGPRMALNWDKQELSEIFHFGKWIFFSSLAGFLSMRLDRIVLGLYLSLNQLGLYGIAFTLAMIMLDLQQALIQKVFIPLYANLWNHSPANLKVQTFKLRLIMVSLSLPLLFILMLFSQQIIKFLYPPAYVEAAWMLKILAVAGCIKCVTVSIDPILLAVGNSFRQMVFVFGGCILLLMSIFLGGYFFGILGVMWAIPLAELLNYPILILMIYRYGVWLPLLDLPIFIFIALVTFLSFK